MKELCIRFIREDEGQDLVEYALVTAALGLGLIATVGSLATGVRTVYEGFIGDLTRITGLASQ
jgi:Flp pilus assembly pilin Flp